MKSRIHNNTEGARDMGTYLELPLQRFLMQMPQYAHLVMSVPVDINDPNYVVRFQIQKDGKCRLEVGYPEDTMWQIGEQDKSKEPNYPVDYSVAPVLDAEIANGGEFIVLPALECMEKYPDTAKLFQNIPDSMINNTGVCFYRDKRFNAMVSIIGDINGGNDYWKKVIGDNSIRKEKSQNDCNE